MSKTGISEAKKELAQSLESALSRNYQNISASEWDGVMRIANLVTSWQGIAAIDISGLDNLVEHSRLAYRASQVIEEMITNTIRYGEADQISVELKVEAMNLQILLTHNGRGKISKKSGLGLEIKSEEGKTYLHISIPKSSEYT
jgi:signal transduction histidine kinase